jgi:FAD synthase
MNYVLTDQLPNLYLQLEYWLIDSEIELIAHALEVSWFTFVIGSIKNNRLKNYSYNL